MNLKEALNIQSKEVISLVGGGGKTTLMFRLAEELISGNRCVLTTTTTKMMVPSPAETERLVVEKEKDALLRRVVSEIDGYRHVTVAREWYPFSKLVGIDPDTACCLAALEGVSHLIIEADGAARRPLKAPRDYEPVIPPNTTLVIAVAGIDAIGVPLEEERVFRSSVAASLLNVPLGTIVSPNLMAKLFTLPSGIPKGTPTAARIVPFINKIDLMDGLDKAREIAAAILAERHPQIPYVVIGQARLPDPVAEVFCRKG